jgi:hypothetical protein
VLRRLILGDDPWVLAEGLWRTGDAATHLWFAGQGLALARGLACQRGQ